MAAGVPYYKIIPCCPNLGTQVVDFNFPISDPIIADGVYVYDNPASVIINGITFIQGQCYTITFVNNAFTTYPQAPTINDFTFADVCKNTALCDPCIEVLKCYTLYPCTSNLPILLSSSGGLATLVGQFTGLIGYSGCYFVVENAPGDCEGASNIRPNAQVICSCELNCYSITGNPVSVTYVNENFELVVTSGNTRICSYISPGVIGGVDGTVYNFGLCVDETCPDVCFTFTNCITAETLIVSNTTTIFGYYENNNVVTLQGYDGCWSIDISEEPCDCAVNVTVLQVFADCPTCLPIIAYKFTNCNNQSIIKYSLDDYSAYVGQTVKLDCGECWFVDLIDYMPPATQTIVIITNFESCLACSRTYYQLDDCLGDANTIYTYTDFSSLIGLVVNLENCDTCWEVSALDIPTIDQSSVATSVNVVSSYVDCATCGIETPCRCSIAWPDELGRLDYIDCSGNLIKLIKLDPNTPTEKLCIRQWITAREPIYFGDCIVSDTIVCNTYIVTVPPLPTNETLYYKDCAGVVQSTPCFISKASVQVRLCGIAGQTSSDIYITGNNPVTFVEERGCGTTTIYTCPVEPFPKRFIKPGYQTPTCDIEKYEKISCNAANILYKTVLTARYGISNCCYAPDDKWLIKKELIDLQAARDPNYFCTPVQSCCNNTPTCGCGCNGTHQTTCNSR